jgi:hypothetical protein
VTTLSRYSITSHIPGRITSQVTSRFTIRLTRRITAVHEAKTVKASDDFAGQIFPLDHQPAISFVRPSV